MASLLLFGDNLGDGDENLNGEKSDTVLIVLNEVLEEGNDLINDNRGWHFLDKLGQVAGSLTADHGGLVVNEQAKLLTELLLDRVRRSGAEAENTLRRRSSLEDVFRNLTGRALVD